MWKTVADITSARLLTYDTERFPFAAIIAAVFKVPALERLHDAWLRHNRRRGLEITPGYADNLKLRGLLQGLRDDSPFYRVYHHFVRTAVAPHFGGRISYSSHPKMRVHLAGTPSVSSWHRDADITGALQQINVWLPCTDTFDSNGLWIESDYGRADYRPVRVRYGEALIFDGGLLSHGTVANDTTRTRVSFDFRFSVKRAVLPEAAHRVFEGRRAGLCVLDPS